MAYMFTEEKTRYPYVKDLLWEGNESATSDTTWEYYGDHHQVDLSQYKEFIIITKEGAAWRAPGGGVLLYTDSGKLLYRYVSVNVDANVNSAYVGECKEVGGSTTHNDFLIPVKFYGVRIG